MSDDCGYGPVDYGECDCAAPSLFDVYAIRGDNASGIAHPHGLVRLPLIAYAVDDVDYSSKIESETLWHIPPVTALTSAETQATLGTLVGGFESDSEIVWALETRDSVKYAVRYDVVTQQELFATSLAAITDLDDGGGPLVNHLMIWTPLAFAVTSYGIGGGTNYKSTAAASGSEWTCLINSHPGTPTWKKFHIDSGGTVSYGSASIVTSGMAIQAMAPRGWPFGAGAQNEKLYVGPLQWVSLGGSSWSLRFDGTPTEVQSGFATATVATWIYFDANPDGNWIGVFVYKDTSTTRKAVLMINGTTILVREVNPATGATPYALQTVFGPVHISYPFEADGLNYYVAPMRDYSTLPSAANSYAGVLADAAKPYIAVVYNAAGTEVWRTERQPHPIVCKASSSRWLYLTGFNRATRHPGMVNSQTGGAESTSPAANHTTARPYWIAKHDGSQTATVGPWAPFASDCQHPFLTYSNVTGPYSQFGVPKDQHDIIHNCALVPFGTPADATTFINYIGDGV